MNCVECEKLFDAYLDGQLVGSLRLEFDAHRVHCRHCQRTLAMLEALGNVIASDTQVPELSRDFGSRVLEEIRQPRQPARWRLRPAVVLLSVFLAAAIVLFAWLWYTHPARPAKPEMGPVATLHGTPSPNDEVRARAMEALVDRLESRLWDMHAAGNKLTTDLVNVARYLNIMIPDDVARESVRLAGVNPLQALWDAIVPGPPAEPEPAATAEDVHAI